MTEPHLTIIERIKRMEETEKDHMAYIRARMSHIEYTLERIHELLRPPSSAPMG